MKSLPTMKSRLSNSITIFTAEHLLLFNRPFSARQVLSEQALTGFEHSAVLNGLGQVPNCNGLLAM